MKRDDSAEIAVAIGAFVTFLVLLAIIFGGCAEWPATRPAAVRRMAESRLAYCIESSHCPDTFLCYAKSRSYCAEQGLERTCGEGVQFPEPRCLP